MRQNMSHWVFKILYSFVRVFKICPCEVFFFSPKKTQQTQKDLDFSNLCRGGKNFELGKKNLENSIEKKDRPRIPFLSFCDNEMIKYKVACNVLQPHLPKYLKGSLCACNCPRQTHLHLSKLREKDPMHKSFRSPTPTIPDSLPCALSFTSSRGCGATASNIHLQSNKIAAKRYCYLIAYSMVQLPVNNACSDTTTWLLLLGPTAFGNWDLFVKIP